MLQIYKCSCKTVKHIAGVARRRRGRWAGIWQLCASRPDRVCQQLEALCVDSAAIDLPKINSERWRSGEEVAVWQLELFTPNCLRKYFILFSGRRREGEGGDPTS